MSSILIVEDDAVLRDVLYDFLSEEHPCYAVGSVEEALKRMEKESFGVVLTDISMPGKSGLELLGHVKQHQPDTVVIMLSGINDEEYAQGLVRMGAFDYLAKPFPLEDMTRSVARALEQHALTHGGSAAGDAEGDDEQEDENSAIFASVQLGGVFSLAELLDIVQRGKMSGYIELHWDKATIKQARRLNKFNGADGNLDEAVLNCAGWIYLSDGLIIDAAIDEATDSTYWRDAEQSLTLLVKLATYIGKGVRAWGFSMAQMERPAKLEVWDNSGKVFSIITSDEAEDEFGPDGDPAQAAEAGDKSEAALSELVFEKVTVDATLDVEAEKASLTF